MDLQAQDAPALAVQPRGIRQFLRRLDVDVDLQLEYFNIGRDWVSVFGARRETDLMTTTLH